MSNGKSKEVPTFPVAFHDFAKGNGMVHAGVETVGPSMTRQEFAAECDINSIMKNYDQYLSDPMRSLRQEPRYLDLADMPQDLMGFMRVQQEGQEAFMRLPAEVRKEFENDPLQFLEYAMNPDNIEGMRELGLAPPPKKEESPAPAHIAVPPGAPAQAQAAPAAPAAGAPAPAAKA